MQDAAILEIFKLVQCLDAAQDRHGLDAARGGLDLDFHFLAGFQACAQTLDGDGFVAIQPERFPAGAFLEGQRQNAHADEVGTMDTLERLRDDRADTEQIGAFCSPVA